MTSARSLGVVVTIALRPGAAERLVRRRGGELMESLARDAA